MKKMRPRSRRSRKTYYQQTEKYVVMLSVLITEDFKQKHVVEKRARDGMFKNLILMV